MIFVALSLFSSLSIIMTVAAAVIISMELSLISCVYFGVLSCSVAIILLLIQS